MFLAVQTAVERSEQRQIIRETWGGACKSLDNCQFVFVLGVSKKSLENQKLAAEAETKRDILQFDILDSYSNLTLKTLHSIRLFMIHD